jgi:hypothetical protein
MNASGQVAAFAFNGTTNVGVLTGPGGAGPLRQVPMPAGFGLVNMDVVSDNGRAAGYGARSADGAGYLLYYDGTTTHAVAPLPEGRTIVMGAIDDAGRIVGSYLRVEGGALAFEPWISGPDGGSITPLPVVAGLGGTADGINDAGRIAGSAGDASLPNTTLPGGNRRAAYWDPGAGGGYGAPAFIAGLGNVASRAVAVSASGAMTGRVNVGLSAQAFFWSGLPGQSATLIETFSPRGALSFMEGRGVNSSGQVVGRYQEAVGASAVFRAFLWDGAGGTRPLDDLVQGWAFESAYAINDAGQILAYGRQAGSTTSEFAIVTLATVPEPGTWVLLGSGLVVLGAVARRRRSPRMQAPPALRA